MSHSLHKKLYLFIYFIFADDVCCIILYSYCSQSLLLRHNFTPLSHVKDKTFDFFSFLLPIWYFRNSEKSDYEGIFINPEPVYIYFSLMKIEKHVFERNIP